MIRGYIALVNSDSPLPAIPAASLYRKKAAKLYSVITRYYVTEKTEFEISVKDSDMNYSFKVE